MESEANGYEGLHRGYSLEDVNIEDKIILDFSLAFDFIMANTHFMR